MDRITKAERAYALAVAAAHEFNNELTVILNSVVTSIRTLEPGHPARPYLLDLQRAAQRCAWNASGLLNYTARTGGRPSSTPFEHLLL